MHPGYMVIGDTELINASRVGTYVQNFMPSHRIKGCNTCLNTREALSYSGTLTYPGNFYPGTYPSPNDPSALEYVDPATDFAPWYQPERPATADFYGLYPLSIQGLDDSTHKMTPLELASGGASIPKGIHGPREIRVVAIAYAGSEIGMAEGLAWLRDTLDTDRCATQAECAGRPMTFYEYCPGETEGGTLSQRVFDASRVMYRVEAEEGPLVIRRWKRPSGHIAKIEFTLVAGVPWRFTLPRDVGQLTGPTANQVPHVVYPTGGDTVPPVLDPLFGQVQLPPTAPSLQAAAAAPPANWFRYSQEISADFTRRAGAGMARVRITSPEVRRLLRLRFYANPLGRPVSAISGSRWDGEFIVTYMPDNSEIIIDGALKRAEIYSQGGVTSATHLLIGSDGRPFEWPDLNCEVPYVLHVDSPVQLGTTVVSLEMSTRE